MNLLERKAHFEFGENWKAYSKKIDQNRIDFAIEGLERLFPEGLAGKTFLDIGCGSGLHSLAALKLGAASVVAIDLDENSVETMRQLLSEFCPHGNWTTNILSIFEASPETLGTFDVVYSWGVLHHTGDMWQAIDRAAALVKPGGYFAIAIYAATAFDSMWRAEKKFYAQAPRSVQWLIRQIYMAAFFAGKAASGQNPIAYIQNYSKSRGMHFSHDAHDWLGGYPYETARPEELNARISAHGFNEYRAFVIPPTRGLLGSGCNEFVFVRDRTEPVIQRFP
jgi:2-polyprenyl-3-methyl-5-hydroxy-6-metoxy-1,4-benzoquinol methylase